MEELVEKYIRSKSGSWSDSTKRSEKYRLRGLTLDMLTKPDALWKYLTEERELKPYAAKTSFIRAGELLDFAMRTKALPRGENVLKNWMADNAKKFKNAYKPKPVKISFEEALERINRMTDEEARGKALQLLVTGMRWDESNSIDEHGQVTGKGGSQRTIPLSEKYKSEFDRSYSNFRYHLKKVGLKPHDLRKLCATKAAELGSDVPDLMAKMGWKSTQMASIYVQERKTKQIADEIDNIVSRKERKHDEQVPKPVRKARRKSPPASR